MDLRNDERVTVRLAPAGRRRPPAGRPRPVRPRPPAATSGALDVVRPERLGSAVVAAGCGEALRAWEEPRRWSAFSPEAGGPVSPGRPVRACVPASRAGLRVRPGGGRRLAGQPRTSLLDRALVAVAVVLGSAAAVVALGLLAELAAR